MENLTFDKMIIKSSLESQITEDEWNAAVHADRPGADLTLRFIVRMALEHRNLDYSTSINYYI